MSDLEERVARVLFDKINEHHVTDPFEDRECLLVDCYLDLDYLARAVIPIVAEEMAKVAERAAISVPLTPGLPDGAEIARRTIASAIRSMKGDQQ